MSKPGVVGLESPLNFEVQGSYVEKGVEILFSIELLVLLDRHMRRPLKSLASGKRDRPIYLPTQVKACDIALFRAIVR